MRNRFADISESIETGISHCLAVLNTIAREAELEYLVVGASARDLVFQHIYCTAPLRGTRDLDLGIHVSSWERFATFKASLLGSGRFRAVAGLPHRVVFDSAIPVDLVPFGAVAEPSGQIAWPPDGDHVMSTIGFQDAFEGAMPVRVCRSPEIVVRVATPPALALMKFVAWAERPVGRDKDARDIVFMARHYGDAGNESLLYDLISGDEDLATFDVEVVSARLLGLHMGHVASGATRRVVEKIIDAEVAEGVRSGFVRDAIGRSHDFARDAGRAAILLAGIWNGLRGNL